MSLDKFSDVELFLEVERRKEAAKKSSIPKAIENPDFSDLIAMCKDYIEEMSDGDYCDDNDSEHFIYECAMGCVFGDSVWKWVNKQKG